MLHTLTSDILPWWTGNMTDPSGGFYGERDFNGALVPGAPKGLILNARILWTFAAAYRVLGREEYLGTALRAADYIASHFTDQEYGGAFWSLKADGSPLDSKKQFYAIAFAIYGYSELYRATSCHGKARQSALDQAIALYRCIEEHSRDRALGGYLEACTRDWKPIEDMRLSEKDRNDAKTMNTHLHILEAYTSLYRVWKDEGLREDLLALTELFADRIIGPDGHLRLFFDNEWNSQDSVRSYGHDIEASWLLEEAADTLGDGPFGERISQLCRKMALAAMEGFSAQEGMIYEFDPVTGRRDTDRHWWVQAETVVGCVNRLQRDGDRSWKRAAEAQWKFIKEHIICPDGEWWWSAEKHPADPRAGFWKCPYHNGRMCLEVIERNSSLF